MSEENVVEVAEVPAPEQVATAAPEPEVVAPEEKPVESPKTFTQEELDAAIGKRLAREQRKWERMQAQKVAVTPQPVAEVPPLENFESPEAYADALATRKAQELLYRQEAERQQAQVLEAYHEREEEARSVGTLPLGAASVVVRNRSSEFGDTLETIDQGARQTQDKLESLAAKNGGQLPGPLARHLASFLLSSNGAELDRQVLDDARRIHKVKEFDNRTVWARRGLTHGLRAVSCPY